MKLLEVLSDISLWRVPTMKVMAKKSGLKDNKSVIYSLRLLKQNGLIGQNYKPIHKNLVLDTSGTKFSGNLNTKE